MSLKQYQDMINKLDKEILDLEKKKMRKDAEGAALLKKINLIEKRITKNISQSTLNSRRRDIDLHKVKLTKIQGESANLEKKIADKKIRRSEINLKLQKEQVIEQKKIDDNNKKILKSYQLRISELEKQVVPSNSPKINVIDENSNNNEEYDVFISHAYEDKESFVDNLVNELKNNNLKVWYDSDKLTWGDSMREKIDKGLSKSKYGIVVLSPNYIAESKYWTKAELNGLFQSETINGKVILPIWHNLTKDQVTKYSLIIADRKAMSTSIMTPKEIAIELRKLFLDN